jgi:hypothetical protein
MRSPEGCTIFNPKFIEHTNQIVYALECGAWILESRNLPADGILPLRLHSGYAPAN